MYSSSICLEKLTNGSQAELLVLEEDTVLGARQPQPECPWDSVDDLIGNIGWHKVIIGSLQPHTTRFKMSVLGPSQCLSAEEVGPAYIHARSLY